MKKYTEQELKAIAAQLFKNSDEAVKYADDHGTFISEAKYNAKKAAAEKKGASDEAKAELAAFKHKFENQNIAPAEASDPEAQKKLAEANATIEKLNKQIEKLEELKKVKDIKTAVANAVAEKDAIIAELEGKLAEATKPQE
jgi:plasmid replication initiation protein